MYGKNHTEETKKKISEKGKIHNKGSNNAMYGKNHTEETKEKISKKKKGKKRGYKLKYKEKVCPYCNKVGAGPNMTRYHFENCKYKKDVE